MEHSRAHLVSRPGERSAELGIFDLADRLDVGDVVARLRREAGGRVVGEALVDQRVVAGIGNVWLAEMLWQVRVSPWTPLGDVSDHQLQRALEWAREAMLASVGGRRARRAVYRRARRGCPRCGEPIRSRGLGEANRTAYWCPRCQPVLVQRRGRDSNPRRADYHP